MSARKQRLLKQHRRNKRVALGIVALFLLALLGGSFAHLLLWWLVPLAVIGVWVIHEAWFADHLFYAPHDDYRYGFPEACIRLPVEITSDALRLNGHELSADIQTLILECEVKAAFWGRLFDPYVVIRTDSGEDRQDFERSVKGRRYLNLSGFAEALREGNLQVRGRFCRVVGPATLYGFSNPDYASKRVMVIAPHADDAELAAFGLYSRCAETSIVTLTQGEIEAEHYERLGLSTAEAARLKGRLRTWDSLAVPLWGGVPMTHCVQLGYFCLQLPAMHAAPDQAFGSRDSGDMDIRPVRHFNPLRLPGDIDGQPSWNNLTADLVALIEHFQPDVMVFPHPQLDPHADHVQAAEAVEEAIRQSAWQPQTALLYANHLHDNDRWPMGPAGSGIALPPAIEPLPALPVWSPVLSTQTQIDKAMALGMQHDLLIPLPLKKRLRRLLQSVLTGRRWPATGEDEFFRKAVRRHELFFVKDLRREPIRD
jgi:LmbE family N-acetylglucosaminyl deacetylase